jgi:uncharacterized protein YgbK (DUF1537 family)
MHILALADDMTGALEVGAQFSGAGIETIVSTEPLPRTDAIAVVLDTETRHVDEETAAREIRRFVKAMGAYPPRLIYKKTDSTLRGNIAAELGALAKLFPDWKIGYAPAYPALGRQVIAGNLYVHGCLVSESEFARDALNPVTTSSVAALLGKDFACTVFDGETDAHLAESALAIFADPTMRIAAGPSGLAGMLAAQMDVPRAGKPRLPTVRTCSILNGSRHPCSAAQVRKFSAPGWCEIRANLHLGGEAAQVARANARYAIEQIALHRPDALFVIGGDTAFAVVRELGSAVLHPISEAVPGVPVTRIADLILITKAGGFGAPDVLTRVHAQLSGEHAE